MLARFARLAQPVRFLLLSAAGCAAIGAATWLSYASGFSLVTAACVYLVLIVGLSLIGSFVSSALFSGLAILCLNYFFIEPLFTLGVSSIEDVGGLFAFLLCSVVVTALVRRLRDAAALQREQAQLLELTGDAVIVRDLAGVITYWNRGAEALYGWSRAEAMGRRADELLRSRLPVPPAEIEEALRRTGRWQGEIVDTRADGGEVHVAARWSLRRDERGTAIGVLACNTDVTERRRAEQALLHSQAAYLSEAQKLSRTGSFGWNLATDEIFWSDETFRIFGVDRAQPISIELIRGRTHPDDRQRLDDVVAAAAAARRGFDLEHRLLMPDGTVRHVRVVAHPVPAPAGGTEFIGAVSDVTENRRAFAALERSERRYRDVFRHMPIGMLQIDSRAVVTMFDDLRAQGVTDLDAHIRSDPEFLRRFLDLSIVEAANELAVRMFGARDAGELLGPITPLWNAGHDTIRRMVTRRYQGELLFEEETKVTTLDGRVIDVVFAVTRTDALAGKSLVGFHDITARVTAQETLNRFQADFAHAARVSVLGELTASLAHEVNQPLAAIAANGEAGMRWLSRPDPDIAELRELTASITADARRAAGIIARIRAMAARKAPEQTLLPFDDVVREALLFLRHEVQSRAVTILHHVAPGAPQVFGDRIQLQQVIVNLTVNSMQAMAKSPVRRIHIRTVAADPATIVCTVEDSGPGIPPEHLPQLFESFFTTKEGGLGMGLPICQSIIDAHGGRITADNDATDGGARFSFALPAAGRPMH